MSTMQVMSAEGDTKHIWDKDMADQVEAARVLFNSLALPPSQGGKGYLAYTVKDDGSTGERVTAFNPEMERVILQPQMSGG